MGKKHSTSKPGGGRTNAIFKIAGANFKEKKSNNKPKEVTSKLKTISMKNKTKVEELDATLVLMQKKSASDGVGTKPVLRKRLSKLKMKANDSGTFSLSR